MLDLSALRSVPQAVATVVAAGVAWHVSKAWRKQQISPRRQQAAEEVLVAARAVVTTFAYLRSPFISAHGMLDEEGRVDMQFGQARAYKRRLASCGTDFSSLRKAVLLTEVHFGGAAARPLRDLFLVRSKVVAAAEMLFAPDSGDCEPEFKIQFRNEVMAVPRSGRPNIVSEEIEQAVAQVEAKLRPHLRLPGEPDPDRLAQRRWYWLGSKRS